jgi:uncharacterized protein (TIGR02284 family)
MTRTDTAMLLNDLIATSHDGEMGYAKAANSVADPRLKSLFVESAMRCREGARELEARVRDMGLKPTHGGSLAGAVHRGWMGVRVRSTQHDERAILEECERGETFAEARFALALQEDLPEDLREVLEEQYEGVLQNHDRVREMRRAFAKPSAS